MSAPAAILSILAAALLFWLAWKYEWLLEPGERKFNEAYRSRKPLSDEAMIEQFYMDSPIDPRVAIETRTIFAHQLQYGRERLHPDDDFTFILAEVDCVELVTEIEEAFGIELSNDELTSTPATIRSASELVQGKLNAKGSNLPAR